MLKGNSRVVTDPQIMSCFNSFRYNHNNELNNTISEIGQIEKPKL